MRILGQEKRVKLSVLPHHEPIFATLNVSIFPRIKRARHFVEGAFLMGLRTDINMASVRFYISCSTP